MMFLKVLCFSIYLFFLPGLVLSLLFFDLQQKKLTWLERIILSIILSVAIVPLFALLCNLLGVSVHKISIFLEVLFLIMFALSIYCFKNSKYYFLLLKKRK